MSGEGNCTNFADNPGSYRHVVNFLEGQHVSLAANYNLILVQIWITIRIQEYFNRIFTVAG